MLDDAKAQPLTPSTPSRTSSRRGGGRGVVEDAKAAGDAVDAAKDAAGEAVDAAVDAVTDDKPAGGSAPAASS